MTHIPDEAVESGARALGGHRFDDLADRSKTALRDEARAVIAAALPHLSCSCPHISEVDDYCPQHGREAS